MVTIGVFRWPTEFGHEVGKRSLEIRSPPDFVQVIGPYMYADENDGIGIVIYSAGSEMALLFPSSIAGNSNISTKIGRFEKL